MGPRRCSVFDIGSREEAHGPVSGAAEPAAGAMVHLGHPITVLMREKRARL